MEYDQFTSPIRVVTPPNSQDFLDVEFPSDKAIHEAMTMTDRLWEDMYHQSFFISKLETLEVEYEINPCLEPHNGFYLKKPQGYTMLCTILYFQVFYFQFLYSIS
jgi:hypothetical protein